MQTEPINEIIEHIGEKEQERAIFQSARKTVFATKEEMSKFCDLFITLLPIRTKELDLLMQVVLTISKNNAGFVEILNEKIVSATSNSNFQEVTPIIFFMHIMHNNGFIEISKIISLVQRYQNSTVFHKNHAALLFTLFMKEIKANDETLYQSSILVFKESCIFWWFHDSFREIFNNFEQFEGCEYHDFAQNELVEVIMRDDIETFILLTSYPLFNVNQRIEKCAFYPSPILQNHPTLLQLAAFYGSIHIVKNLLMWTNLANEKDDAGLLMIDYAAAGGSIECVRLAEQKMNSFNNTLSTAIMYKRRDIINWIIYSKNYQPTIAAAALACARVGDIETFELLGDPSECTDENGLTPLHVAAMFNQCEFIKYLEKLSIVNLIDNQKKTPLHYAAENGNIEAIEALTMCDVNARDKRGMSPLHYAAASGFTEATKTLLKKQGIKVDIKNRCGRTPLFLAVQNGLSEVMDVLIDAGANYENEDKNGDTPIITAIIAQQTSTVAKLIMKYTIPIINETNPYNKTIVDDVNEYFKDDQNSLNTIKEALTIIKEYTKQTYSHHTDYPQVTSSN